MRAKVEASTLAAALKRVAPASKVGYTATVGMVRVTATSDGLRLRCDNGDLCIDTAVPASVDATGEAIASASLLDRFFSGRDGAALLDADGGTLEVEVGSATLRLRCRPDGDQWPLRDPVAGDARPLTTEWDGIRRAAVAASDDQQRVILTGVVFDGDRVIGTDSYRLHQYVIDGLGIDAVVPKALVTLVGKTIDVEQGATIRSNERSVQFDDGATTWISHLVEGSPPRAQPVLDAARKALSYHLTLDTKALLDAIETAAVVGDNTTAGRIVSLRLDGSELVVAASTNEVGDAVALAACSGDLPPVEQGRQFAIGFDHRYLAEAVRCAAVDEVTLATADRRKPALIEAGPFTALVMPNREAP